jgi:hypothetical protein
MSMRSILNKSANNINIPNEFRAENIKKFIKKKVKLGNEAEILSWTGKYIIYQLFYIYLFKKYGHSCFVKSVERGMELYLDISKDIPNFNPDKINERSNKNILNIKNNLKSNAKQMLNCIKRGQIIITIPVFLNLDVGGHANLLIYNKNFNTLSLFEPYGSLAFYKYDNLKDQMLEYLTNVINEDLDKDGKVTYERADVVCPTLKGFQKFEEYKTNIYKHSKEGGGYCAVWSLFFTELSLANPDKSTKDLYNSVLDYIINEVGEENAGNYLRYVARGYVKIVNEKIKKYFNNLYDVEIAGIDDYVHFINNMTKETLNKYNEITDIYVEILFEEGEGDSIECVYDAYEVLIKKPEYKILIDNPKSRFGIKYKIIKKLYNKEILKTPTSRSQSVSFSENIRKTEEVIENKIKEIISISDDDDEHFNDVKQKHKPPCKTGKERNEKGRCVKIKTEKIKSLKVSKTEKIKSLKVRKTEKIKSHCKPGKERNEKGRCVKIKSPKTEKIKPLNVRKLKTEKIKPSCKPGKERNENGRCVKIKI